VRCETKRKIKIKYYYFEKKLFFYILKISKFCFENKRKIMNEVLKFNL